MNCLVLHRLPTRGIRSVPRAAKLLVLNLERALTTVVATCYLLGVSTRRMEKLVDALGITRLSKSQVSVMAAELHAQVGEFRGRPLDAGPYTLVAADTLVRPRSARAGGWQACSPSALRA